MKTVPRLQKMFWFVATVGWWMPTMVAGQEPTMAPTMNGTLAPVVPTQSPTLPPFEFPECFNSTALIFQAMLRASSFVAQTYIMCPNTRTRIGFFRQDGTCCDNGDSALTLRSRSIVKCGESGESSNNCTLVGGNAHIFYVGSLFGDILAQDVRIEGFTFEATDFISTAMANRGDVTYYDCIWKVSVPCLAVVTRDSMCGMWQHLNY